MIHNRIITNGQAKIRAGAATTRFAATDEATKNTVACIFFDETEPQTEREQIRYVRRQVEKFNELMTKCGYAINDTADGCVLARRLASAAKNLEFDAESAERMRREFRRELLESAVYQGKSDAEKQTHYELRAVFAVEAAGYKVKAARAESVSEKRAAEMMPTESANYILDFSVELTCEVCV